VKIGKFEEKKIMVESKFEVGLKATLYFFWWQIAR
jgi:hypothetical protein